MKKLPLVFLRWFLISCIAVTACNDSDSSNSNSNPNSKLIGTWELVSLAVTQCQDPDDDNTSYCGADPSKCETVVITATTISFDGDDYTYTVSGNTIIFNGETWTYTVTSTSLTLAYQIPDDCIELSSYSKA